MTTDLDLMKIAEQERALQFSSMDPDTAWQIGSRLRRLAIERDYSVVIDVRRFMQQLFFCAIGVTTPDHSDWVRRKTNTVARFLRSSYAIGLSLEQKQTDITTKYALPVADYVTHGGSFPLTVAGAGVIGAITVSGLDQRADHELVVEALCAVLGKDYAVHRLG